MSYPTTPTERILAGYRDFVRCLRVFDQGPPWQGAVPELWRTRGRCPTCGWWQSVCTRCQSPIEALVVRPPRREIAVRFRSSCGGQPHRCRLSQCGDCGGLTVTPAGEEPRNRNGAPHQCGERRLSATGPPAFALGQIGDGDDRGAIRL